MSEFLSFAISESADFTVPELMIFESPSFHRPEFSSCLDSVFPSVQVSGGPKLTTYRVGSSWSVSGSVS